MSWTDERVNLLKKLWGEGKTAAEIAKELGDVTRNAVIGKAHRLKLSNRLSPIQQNTKKPARPVEDKPVLKKPANDKPRREDVFRPSAEGVKMQDLKDSMCRWPLGDPKEPGFRLCGCRRMAGLPYCTEHAKIAYQAATRNRILQAQDTEKRTHEAADKKEALAG